VQFQLLILESIGTQELILVGLVALIVFGPRKLPEMARKFGKMMTELRKVSSDFRSTWEREASMVESAFKMDETDQREPRAIGSSTSEAVAAPEQPQVDSGDKGLPSVKELSTEDFEKFTGGSKSDPAGGQEESAPVQEENPSTGKADWL
jgi:Tat protein translocase TatB subunit